MRSRTPGVRRSVSIWNFLPSWVIEVDFPVPDAPETSSPRRPSCLPRLLMSSFDPVVMIFLKSGVATSSSVEWKF